jgi:hypothetical protein
LVLCGVLSRRQVLKRFAIENETGEEAMLRKLFAGGATALLLSGSLVHAQPVTTFAEVAGKWSGVGSRGGKTDITIGADGKFVTESPLGTVTGVARIESGILVLAASNNQSHIKFSRTGDVLEGPYVWGTLSGTTRVTRLK